MKNLYKTIATLTLTSLISVSFAQDFKTSLYTTITGHSYATGTTLGLLLPGYTGDIELGVFYETSASILNENEAGVEVISSNYKGISTSFSAFSGKSFDIGLNVKFGMESNSKEISILPALAAEYFITPKFGIGAAAVMQGIAMPSAQIKVSFCTGGLSKRLKRRSEYASRRAKFQEMRQAYALNR